MFHIVFNANESYIKYLAVLCYSIIFNSSKTEKTQNKEAYHFHLLTDGLTSQTQAKLLEFEALLKEIYPCKISFYVLDDKEFQGFPKLNESYLTYFRLKMSKILPQDISRCLYLDVDMLCLSDIREVFRIDLAGKICGVVKDAHYKPLRIMQPKERSGGGGVVLDLETYFNAGFMLVDLEEWRKQRVEERCFEYLRKYIPEWHDQDVLNAALGREVLLFPLEWNLMEGHFEHSSASFKENGYGHYMLAYTQEEYFLARERIKIVHFISPKKPWSASVFTNASYRNQWWEFALQTPVFSNELQLCYLRVVEETLIDLINQSFSMRVRIFIRAMRRELRRIIYKLFKRS